MNSHKPVTIGLIYANWCRHCQKLMPIWDAMRTSIDDKSYRPPPKYMVIEQSNLGELDRFNSENAAYLKNERVHYNGFPTIFKIKDGKIDYYKDSRDPSSLEKWFMGDNRMILQPRHKIFRQNIHQRYKHIPHNVITRYRIMTHRLRHPKMISSAKTKQRTRRTKKRTISRRLRRTISNR